MHKKIQLFTAVPLALGLGFTGWHFLSQKTQEPSQGQVPLAKSAPSSSEDSSAEKAIEDSAEELRAEEMLALLADPRVTSYFKREKDKQILAEYFAPDGNGGEHNAEDVWQLIESIESEGRVMAYEALALKLEWLERNSANKQEFEQAAQGLVENYRQKSEQNMREYNPYEDVPGFAEYKEMEKRIIQEVQQMSSFPDGMTEQQYLRKRLQEAREKAYGS
jgi:hypothetical protein